MTNSLFYYTKYYAYLELHEHSSLEGKVAQFRFSENLNILVFYTFQLNIRFMERRLYYKKLTLSRADICYEM